MSNCVDMHCSHIDEKTGACTFSGKCIIQQYALDNVGYMGGFLDADAIRAEKYNQAQAVATEFQRCSNVHSGHRDETSGDVVAPRDLRVVFNPFQRGNGCMLAGYTHDEIFAHTR